jgi:diacylglycerol kinase (ATP)
MEINHIKEEFLVLVNPNAGGRTGERDWDKISELLKNAGVSFYHKFTEHKNHAVDLVKSHIEKGFRKIIVVGGDGTMNEVVHGIFNQNLCQTNEITLGIIPVGTGNDWCRTFNISSNYSLAIRIIKDNKTTLQDIGHVTYYDSTVKSKRYFSNVAGIGFDAFVAKRVNKKREYKDIGKLEYFRTLLTSLLKTKFIRYKIMLDDSKFDDEVFSMSIGIGKFNGGGIMQLPNAITDDGLLDITIIKRVSKFTIIMLLRKLYDGTFIKNKRVHVFQAKKVKIETESPVYLETDGESLGHSPFEFGIEPRSLRVFVN